MKNTENIRPESVTCLECDDRLTITIRWSKIRGFVYLFAASAIAVGLILYPVNIGSLNLSSLWPVVVLVGVGFSLMPFLFSTLVVVSKEFVEVKTLPFSVSPTRFISVASIVQVFVEEHIVTASNGKSASYSLKFKDTSGDTRTLVRRIGSLTEGVYLEKTIESYLGIEDDYFFETNDR